MVTRSENEEDGSLPWLQMMELMVGSYLGNSRTTLPRHGIKTVHRKMRMRKKRHGKSVHDV